MTLLELLAIDLPIVQAPMAGVSTPAMAAAVANAGALGSIGVGATDAEGARKMMTEFRERSSGSLDVNVLCHRRPQADASLEAAWLAHLRPHFESDADSGYRAALTSDAAHHTVMTRAISGRAARCLANGFTALSAGVADHQIPAYPIAYDAGKALNAAAKAAGDTRFGAQWAGQGAPLVRAMPAAELVATLVRETR